MASTTPAPEVSSLAKSPTRSVDVPALTPSTCRDPFLLELFDDIDRAEELLDRNDLPFTRRVFVRTFTAGVEAMVGTLCEPLGELKNVPGLSSRQVILIARLLATVRGRTSHENVVRPVLEVYAALRNCDEEFFIVGEELTPGWRGYRKVRRTRNKLTHPDRQHGVSVTDDELAAVRQAKLWLFETLEVLETA